MASPTKTQNPSNSPSPFKEDGSVDSSSPEESAFTKSGEDKRGKNTLTELVPNMAFIRGYAFAQGIGSMQLAFALTQSTQLSPFYQVFFDWSEEELTFWNTVMNASMTCGLIIGSVFGSMIITSGRRRSLILI